MKRRLISLLIAVTVISTIAPVQLMADELNAVDGIDIIESNEVLELGESVEIIDNEEEIGEIIAEDEIKVAKEGDYIEISDADGLLAAAERLNEAVNAGKKYKLTANIDMQGEANWVMPKYNPAEFDGNGHTISNMTIKTFEYDGLESIIPYPSCKGMFSKTTVKNLTLNNTIVDCNDRHYSDGEYAVMIGSGSAINCKLTGKTMFIADEDRHSCNIAGGIVGLATGDVIECSVDGEIDFTSLKPFTACGGIVGSVLTGYENDEITIDGCETTKNAIVNNSGNTSQYVAGIVGTANRYTVRSANEIVNIINCKNRASIKGNNIAGIMGGGEAVIVLNMTDCSNFADFVAEKDEYDMGVVCGIINRWGENATLVNCINEGDLIGNNGAYGIAFSLGVSDLGTFEPASTTEINIKLLRCANKGNITAARENSTAAGLVGYMFNGIAQESYNIGNVSGEGYYIAGLVSEFETSNQNGAVNKAKMSKCYNGGTICGGNYVAGLVSRVGDSAPVTPFGYNESDTLIEISDCFNYGIVYGYPIEGHDPESISGLINDVCYAFFDSHCKVERCYNVGAVAPYLYDDIHLTATRGNQIVNALSAPYYVNETTFEEKDCYYYNDSLAKTMEKDDNYSLMAKCQISEIGKSEAELKNVYDKNSDIWVSGKVGYMYPYLKGVGENDLPTSYDHKKQVEELNLLIYKNLYSDYEYTNKDKNGRAIKITVTSIDSNGNRVPIDLKDFYKKVDSNAITLQQAKKMKVNGYTFKGWFVNGKKVKKLTMVSLDDETTLEARYTVNKYNIKYKVKSPAKGIKVTGKIMPDKKIEYTGEITIKGSEVTAPGYRLAGFTTDKKGTTADIKVGDIVSLSRIVSTKKSVTLYAIWVPDK